MSKVYIDFETAYSQVYSLFKMTTQEYIYSPHFEIIGVAMAFDDGPIIWYDNRDDKAVSILRATDWSEHTYLSIWIHWKRIIRNT